MKKQAPPGARNRALEYARGSYPFWALVGLLACAFLMGGGSREDTLSIIVLRPVAAVALALGLWGLTREELRQFRLSLLFLGASVLLIAFHLVPLPPAIWGSLPGREIAVEVDRVSGIGQPWRPLTLVPWRGWNSLFAMTVPAAAMVLAIRCTPQQRERVVIVVLVLGLLSALFAYLQAISGYHEALYLYRITNKGWPTGFFANRNHQAVMIACLFPLLAFVATLPKPPKQVAVGRWLLAAVAAALFLLQLITGSRAGFAASIIGLAAAAMIIMRDRQLDIGKARRRLWVAAVGAGVLGAVVAVAIFWSHAAAIDRIFATDTVEEMRPEIWGVTWRAISDYLPVGSGIGSFVEVYRMHEPTRALSSSYVNHAHNDWLELALEGGIPAMLLMLTAVAAFAAGTWPLFRGRRTLWRSEQLSLAGAAIILILGLSSVVDYPLRVPSLSALVAIAAVWMVGSGREKLPAETLDQKSCRALTPPSPPNENKLESRVTQHEIELPFSYGCTDAVELRRSAAPNWRRLRYTCGAR